jgi:tetratricopeptide (TPR) repeat protein
MGIFSRKDKSRPVHETPEKSEPAAAKIERLFAEARNLPWTESEKKVALYTELLDLIAANGTPANSAAVLRNRGIAYRSLNRFTEALKDFRAELEWAQGQSDRMRVMKCQEIIEETEAWQRKEEIAAGGGEKAEKLAAMERDQFLIWKEGPETEKAFAGFFADLTHPDPDVRAAAARILAESPPAREKLIALYRSTVDSDPGRASLSGRVLGRSAAKGSDEMIQAEIARMLFGLDVSFLPCPCVHCGRMNRGIPAPSRAPYVAYYHQDNDRGAYAIPVLCDGCGKEFYVVWDRDPR